MKTSDLIAALAKDLPPVRRLRPPLVRAACWLAVAFLVLALLAISQGIRQDLVSRLHDPAFALSMASSLLTGALAALAAFQVSLPDRSRLWLLLPLPALVVWLSNIGYQCLTQWIGPEGVTLGEAARCFATLVLTGLPLSLMMMVMLRYTVLLHPTAATLMGSLAVAAITATALALFHVMDASAMILIWNLGTAALFLGLGTVFGRGMLRRLAPQPSVAAN
ncbi:hypothetical protein M2281_001330 [Mesorhizobium soli]|uniref:NrsF family protein n=1 Tax=Pseudaminobacter soli (ex Li et al. 2025) TaxID=1295366 RepID=UPI002474F3E0|nr:NrsF family protein [Mesorhizobium soli]MDH6230758.1 hypothetical protein [Mesorhizobium soli]